MVSNSCMWLNCVQSYVRLKKPLCLCIFMPRAKLSFFIFVTAFSDFNVPLRESMSPQISIKFVPMVADTIQWGVSIGIRGVLDLDFATETEKRREVGFAIFERFYTSNKYVGLLCSPLCLYVVNMYDCSHIRDSTVVVICYSRWPPVFFVDPL